MRSSLAQSSLTGDEILSGLIAQSQSLMVKLKLLCCSGLIFSGLPNHLSPGCSFSDKNNVDIWDLQNNCKGRYLISDDKGNVCDALSLDSRTRCCPLKGERFSCHGCNVLSQCCSSYEFCVSCCLNPTRTLLEKVVKVKVAKPTTAGTYKKMAIM